MDPALYPPPPDSLEAAGLSDELVAGLTLKALHGRGATMGFDLVDLLALPMALLDEVLEQLQERRFIEVHATRGPRRGEFVFKLTSAGRERAAEELEVSRYVGPAPVPFEEYRRWVERQSIGHVRVTAAELESVLEGIEVDRTLLDQLGPAVNSARSLFLHGGPGNGKTLLAERIARLFGERYFVPYSVLVDGAVMVVYDPVHHRRAERSPGGSPDETDASATQTIVRSVPEHDRRFAEALRPIVRTGGELTLDQLDLRWDPSGRMYQAPPQLKAAGGVLVVDDLGRQRVPVRDLLNRWVVPLEQRMDHLTLRSGRKIVVPFDSFVIFSTNLEPQSLADEAFLRRIHYKVEVSGPDREEYEAIFRSCCAERAIPFEAGAVDYLFSEFYGQDGIEPRRCHPRDVLDHVRDLAEYRETEPTLGLALLEPACRSYFLPTGGGSHGLEANGASPRTRTLDPGLQRTG